MNQDEKTSDQRRKFNALVGLKFEKELSEMFEYALCEDWMSDETCNEMLDLTLATMGKDPASLDSDIQTGIDNGYSTDKQMEVLKMVIKANVTHELRGNGE